MQINVSIHSSTQGHGTHNVLGPPDISVTFFSAFPQNIISLRSLLEWNCYEALFSVRRPKYRFNTILSRSQYFWRAWWFSPLTISKRKFHWTFNITLLSAVLISSYVLGFFFHWQFPKWNASGMQVWLMYKAFSIWKYFFWFSSVTNSRINVIGNSIPQCIRSFKFSYNLCGFLNWHIPISTPLQCQEYFCIICSQPVLRFSWFSSVTLCKKPKIRCCLFYINSLPVSNF
jgi:hypothetical protein